MVRMGFVPRRGRADHHQLDDHDDGELRRRRCHQRGRHNQAAGRDHYPGLTLWAPSRERDEHHDLNGRTIATSGDGAEGFWRADTSGRHARAGLGFNTTGLEALGVERPGGDLVDDFGHSISTTGDASKGLLCSGVGSSLTASDLTVTTKAPSIPRTAFMLMVFLTATGGSYSPRGDGQPDRCDRPIPPAPARAAS